MSLLSWLPVLAAAISASGTQVTWTSSPTLANESVLIAGSGLGQSAIGNISLTCGSSKQTQVTFVQWDMSIRFVLPDNCRPAHVKVGARVLPLNQPDIWWIRGSKSLSTAQPGSTISVYGRSLAWDNTVTRCLSADQLVSAPTTIMYMDGNKVGPTTRASCYEAHFVVPISTPAGHHEIQIETPWGLSDKLELVVAEMPEPPTCTSISVDTQFDGNLTAALMHAGSLHGCKTVVLGPNVYELIRPARVPTETDLIGAGMQLSQVSISLSESSPVEFMLGCNGTFGIYNVSIVVFTAPELSPVVYAQPGSSNVTIQGVNITMLQENVSTALKLETDNFEVADNVLQQLGVCLDGKGPFQPSTTIYLHNSNHGWIHDNIVRWKCSFMDLDVSNHMVVEDNTIECINAGLLPHGNSISVYDWRKYPSSRFWSYSRNSMSRPPHNNHRNWIQRETVTTDGSGGWGSGPVHSISSDRMSVTLNYTLLAPNYPPIGATLIGLSGPGVGATHLITTYSNDTSGRPVLGLASPIGDIESLKTEVGVVTSSGLKLIVGNKFSWTEVVQWYGNTQVGVMADNTFENCNVQNGGNGGAAVLSGVGECYHGPAPLFFCEYLNNSLINSNGIGLRDGSNSTEPECANSFNGPFVRWQVIRRNMLSGVSESMPHRCGDINATSIYSSDIVAEHNTQQCVPGVTPGNTNVHGHHSIVRT